MVVITYGTYDIIHYGHIGFLKRAKELAGPNGKLIVGLSTDNFHEKLKHKPRCYFTYEQRKQVLEGIGYVDGIFPEETWEQKAKDIQKYNADILVMGDDWKGKFDGFKTVKCKVMTLPRCIEGQDPISDTLLKNDNYNKIAPSHNKLDLIFPFVDNQDSSWQEQYIKYKNMECENDVNVANNQTFDIRRFRSWNHLNYLFRGFEKNIPWVNRIFLVLSSKSQIPKWLNVDNPKLRIVYHEDYMPKEVLPSFNALSIESFYSFIPELSEYFIASNDDWFFLNPIPKEFFIDNGCLQLAYDPRSTYWAGGGKDSTDSWQRMINNVFKMEMDMHNNFGRLHLKFTHLPEIRCKALEQEWFNTKGNMKTAIDMFSKSKFRHKDNAVLNWFFIHLLKFNCDRIPFKISTKKYQKMNCGYCQCEKDDTFEKYSDSGIVCFNDSSRTPTNKGQFEELRNRLVAFLNKKFPEKSSFEL